MIENENKKESNYNLAIFMGLGLTFGIVFDKLALGLALGVAIGLLFQGKKIKFK
ncbi:MULTISPECIES: hypothetical protein [Clostridium]|uniref:hypothetical protein n=1 Tax=Clostridium TaxID=1485 RepID=UPI0014424466|nr:MULTISPECIES: hypothetical protein [Clostridium]MBS5939007.1 hypothetical protein [Clostridium sp.]